MVKKQRIDHVLAALARIVEHGANALVR